MATRATLNAFREVARRVENDGFRTPQFLPGWEHRGKENLQVRGCIRHWTAGPRTGNAPSLALVTNGASRGIHNALANTFSSREPRLIIVAADTAWHGGRGRHPTLGLATNRYFLGHEPECSGPGDWSKEHLALYDSLTYHEHVVFGFPLHAIVDHYEYATPPGRKIDCKDGTGGPNRRARIARYNPGADPGGVPTPIPEEGFPEMLLYRYHEDRGGVKSTHHVIAILGDGSWTRLPGGKPKFGSDKSALDAFAAYMKIPGGKIPPILPVQMKEQAPAGYRFFSNPQKALKRTWHIGPDPRK